MAKYFGNPSWRNGVDVHYGHWPYGAQFAHPFARVLAAGVRNLLAGDFLLHQDIPFGHSIFTYLCWVGAMRHFFSLVFKV